MSRAFSFVIIWGVLEFLVRLIGLNVGALRAPFWAHTRPQGNDSVIFNSACVLFALSGGRQPGESYLDVQQSVPPAEHGARYVHFLSLAQPSSSSLLSY
jgi:uncharacterized membrane protein required for colicin V production